METQLVLPLEEAQTKDMELTSADDLPDVPEEEWTEAEQIETDQLDEEDEDDPEEILTTGA